jgi:hypothetical protein
MKAVLIGLNLDTEVVEIPQWFKGGNNPLRRAELARFSIRKEAFHLSTALMSDKEAKDAYTQCVADARTRAEDERPAMSQSQIQEAREGLDELRDSMS